MSIVILIPCVVCIVCLFRWPLTKTFLNVYLGVLLLVPGYYFWKISSLPPINFTEAVLAPLGIAVLVKEWRHWRPSLTDLAFALFLFTVPFAEWDSGTHTNATFLLVDALVRGGVPYIIGKVLIESHGIRLETARRFAFLLFAGALPALYEYRMGQNPYTLFWSRFFPDETFAWKTQIRWGYGRVSGPFGQSELAGIMLFAGLIFALWVARRRQWGERFRYLPHVPVAKAVIIAAAIFITLVATQARGPWLGCLAAVPVALIGWSRNVKRTGLIVGALMVLFFAVTYSALKNYANGAPASTEQETAQYRQQLLDHYIPVAQEGGLWGWGNQFPRIAGQDSIDNEYLLVALMHGMVGLGALAFLILATLTRLAWIAFFTPDPDDRTFAFALLGIFVGVLGTIATVFLGNQTYELFFLLIGWSQGLRSPVRVRARSFVFEQVYT